MPKDSAFQALLPILEKVGKGRRKKGDVNWFYQPANLTNEERRQILPPGRSMELDAKWWKKMQYIASHQRYPWRIRVGALRLMIHFTTDHVHFWFLLHHQQLEWIARTSMRRNSDMPKLVLAALQDPISHDSCTH